MDLSLSTFGELFVARSHLLMQVFWEQLRLFTPWWLAGIVAGAVLSQLLPTARWSAQRWLNGPLGCIAGALLGKIK